jgi:signal transduction histidine kinase
MSAIASAFSQFATMPTGQSERTNVVVTAKRALELYKEAHISLDVADENLYAQLDSTQLVRVVNNLLSNALQATNDIANPKIEVRIDADTNWLTFEVCDNGKGISEEVRERIFEPMFTTKTSGMGLGLSMVKSIVETYGGTVDFDSDPNRRTCFKLRFPRVS